MNPNYEQPSMPDKPNQRGRQMTLRESDGRIVPTKLDDQSSGQKPGNAGVGKAARPTRDSDQTLPALRGGNAVINRLDRIHHITKRGGGQVSAGSRMRRRRRSCKSARGRIYEGADSIGHGSNIVTPPEETDGQQGTQTSTYPRETPAYSPRPLGFASRRVTSIIWRVRAMVLLPSWQT